MTISELVIFDIDGTITQEGRDSWFELTESLVTDSPKFDKALAHWKEKKYEDPYGESLLMMEAAVELFPGESSSEYLIGKAEKHFENSMREDGFIRADAVQAIIRNHKLGRTIVFATTSYQEAGVALVKKLKEKNYLSRDVVIHVTGTEVNWTTRKLIHFNMGDRKVDGVAKVLGVSREHLKGKITEAFGDDPLGNDSGILREASRSYVITTQKNQDVDISSFEGLRVQW